VTHLFSAILVVKACDIRARARLKGVLVESVRIDGKPRQKYIEFLGSTSIDGLDRPARQSPEPPAIEAANLDCRNRTPASLNDTS
jgi:hypothetical protein